MKTSYFVLKSLFTYSDPHDFIGQKIVSKFMLYPDIISRTSFFLFMLLMQSDVTVDENVCSRLGLKLKLPYLDPRLVEFAFSIDPRYKLKGKDTKYLLRKVAEHYMLLPPEIVQQEKMVFTTSPLFNEESLSQELRECIHNTRNTLLRKILYHASKSRDLSLITNTLVLYKWYEYIRGEF